MFEQSTSSPESIDSSYRLEAITMEEMSKIVEESNHSFLAPASNPKQSTKELLAKMSSDPKFTAFGYKKHGIPISYIIALSHKDPSTISIGPMYVSEVHRGKGLGRKQVEDFNDWARKQGYSRVFTKTWTSNDISRKLFESLGFTVSGIKHNNRANGDSSIIYLLQLDS